jgi:aldehyde:ferredoxin oxidoreductase
MGIDGGLAGNVLRVDLSDGKISTEDTERYAERFIGGRGINDLILLNEMSPEIKWSDPENMLLFGVGALVGTVAPGACRMSVDTKNAFNNGIGSANVGGYFPAELKYAGFDNVVIKGKSEKPVYLLIRDGTVELRDAKSVWGKTTCETERILQKKLGDDQIKLAAIGPAGENLVRGSAVICDRSHAAGGSGVGCVMGDKKLKALVARGRGSIKVAQPERFMTSVDIAYRKVKHSAFGDMLRRYTLFAPDISHPHEQWPHYWFPVRNGQDDYMEPDKIERIVRGLPKYRKKIVACFNCPTGCIPFFEMKSGKYKGTKGEGFWGNSFQSWVSRFDNVDVEAALKAQLTANQLGLDIDDSAVVISWAFECYEKGLLTKEDTDGLELTWGNGDAMVKMVKKLAHRQGVGNFLADGVKAASEKLGKGSEKFAIHMKGQDSLDAYRGAKGWGLAISTSPVAGRHLRGSVVESGNFYPKVEGLSKLDEYKDKPQMVFWMCRTKGIEDMTGICSYVGTWGGALEPSDFAALTSSAMGIVLTEEEFMLISRRLYNLEKAFNTIHTNFDRKDDLPPRRYMEEPIKSGPWKGYKCDRDKWNEMLDEFYELHGWDKETGLQTRKGLTELGLEDVADKLEQTGKLINK